MSKSFSDELRSLIETSGMTRYELAKLSGVQQSALGRFMRSERGLTTDSVDRLAEALGLELRRRSATKRKAKGG